MAIGERIRTALGNESTGDFKLYACGACSSTLERTEHRDGMTCPACGSDRVGRATTVDSHT